MPKEYPRFSLFGERAKVSFELCTKRLISPSKLPPLGRRAIQISRLFSLVNLLILLATIGGDGHLYQLSRRSCTTLENRLYEIRACICRNIKYDIDTFYGRKL